jgi:hypothetical protein
MVFVEGMKAPDCRSTILANSRIAKRPLDPAKADPVRMAVMATLEKMIERMMTVW